MMEPLLCFRNVFVKPFIALWEIFNCALEKINFLLLKFSAFKFS